jgi:hypothetical protein
MQTHEPDCHEKNYSGQQCKLDALLNEPFWVSYGSNERERIARGEFYTTNAKFRDFHCCIFSEIAQLFQILAVNLST